MLRFIRQAFFVFVGLSLFVLVAGLWYGRWTYLAKVSVTAPIKMPIRIAVMGDFHIGRDGKGIAQTQSLVQLALEQNPDIIVLVGDFVTSSKGIPFVVTALQDISAPLGIYAVLGNHDHWAGGDEVAKALRNIGIRVLVNESVMLRKGKERLVLVGIDDLWAGKPDWQKAFAKVPQKVPVVLLSHNPDASLHPFHRRAVLIISGHTHGGHVWMPYFVRRVMMRLTGGKFIPATEYGRRYPYGLKNVGSTWVYVTSGVTKGNRTPRWFTRPEVAIVELHPEHYHQPKMASGMAFKF